MPIKIYLNIEEQRQNQDSSQSLPAPPCRSFLLTLLPAPARGLSRGCRETPAPAGSLPGPQGPLCRGSAWSPSCPPAALPSGLAGLFLPLFPSALAAGQRFALPYPGFPRGARPGLRGSAVPCAGAVGAAWNRLCPARGSPGRSPQGPTRQSPAKPAPNAT